MKAYIEFTIQSVIEACVDQTSLDLQSMRVRDVEDVNGKYDDWVMTHEVLPIVAPIFEEVAADMAFALRSMVEKFEVDMEDAVQFTLNVEGAGVPTTAGNMTMQYFKYRVLAWWYQYRDADLSAAYMAKAEVSLNNVFMLCIPHSGTSIGRYF